MRDTYRCPSSSAAHLARADPLTHHSAFAVPWILLVLAESPGHGYDLIHRLREVGFEWGSPSGPIYRELRRMTAAGLVSARMVAQASGPCRQVYELTPAGRAELDVATDGMRRLRSMITSYLDRYLDVEGSPADA